MIAATTTAENINQNVILQSEISTKFETTEDFATTDSSLIFFSENFLKPA